MNSPNADLKGQEIYIVPILSPKVFMPFGQKRHILDTTPFKNKLDVRAIQEKYLRVLGPDLLLVQKSDSKRVATIRAKEFVLSQHTPKTRQKKMKRFE